MYGRNHFIEKENPYLGKNDRNYDFKLRMTKKKSPFLIMNTGFKERTEGRTTRVYREKRHIGVINYINLSFQHLKFFLKKVSMGGLNLARVFFFFDK